MLYFIKAYIKADKFVYNYYHKILRFINKKWGYKAITYIRNKKFPEYRLKLMATIVKRYDI